ncbi:MAG: thiamine monophosphate kinase [Candidatus Bathyarchaeota archaeon BA1]|nr:MAG: thiamine monophosphate kinase [Candidatus Bathyarchaeota archaeon BA1]
MPYVYELGERKVIEIITRYLERMPGAPLPIGDDAAAIDIGHGSVAVIHSDMLVGKTDVPPGMSLWQAARKSVVMNISDLAAKGVRPIAILASIGVPRGLNEKDIEQVGKGLNEGAREYNAYVLGGDTNEASDLVISCAAFGICKKRYLMKRSGAKPGDIAAVTGFFGKTASGLKILLEKFSAHPEVKKELVDAVFMPRARLKEGLALAQTRAVTASIDSSDGLAWSLHEISRASNVGFFIDDIPMAFEAKGFAKIHNIDPVGLCLYGGEEYELLVTIKRRLWEKAREAVESVEASLIKIGLVTEEKNLLLRWEGKTIPIEARGWEHFKTARIKT